MSAAVLEFKTRCVTLLDPYCHRHVGLKKLSSYETETGAGTVEAQQWKKAVKRTQEGKGGNVAFNI